jgi:hypothetical protein
LTPPKFTLVAAKVLAAAAATAAPFVVLAFEATALCWTCAASVCVPLALPVLVETGADGAGCVVTPAGAADPLVAGADVSDDETIFW